MVSPFALEDRNYLRQSYFEAERKEDATEITHDQALLGKISPFSRRGFSRERVASVEHNSLGFPQVKYHQSPLLSGKMITDLNQGSFFSVSEESTFNTSLTEAITKNQKWVWYRFENWSYESSILEFCRSFFASRPIKEERSIQIYLISRIINLTFCQQEIDPNPELLADIRYLVMCKVLDFADIRFSEMEEELQQLAAGQREYSKKKLSVIIHTIREKADSLCGKLSALETRPLFCQEELSFVKQALSLYETEMSYAITLDKIARKKDYVEELRCMMALGKLYAKKREKQALIQSAGMYQYALRLIEDPQYLPAMQPEIRHTRRAEILNALGQVEVHLLHLMGIQEASLQEAIERAKVSFVTNRENLHDKRKTIDREIEKLGEEPSPQQIAGINCLTANLMKVFTAQLIKQCIAALGKEPCFYAIIGLGSMAREEMTHYSDLEFAILIAEGADQHKEYFKNLTYLLHLKVVNLGETILPALNIPCLTGKGGVDFFDGITLRGFAFDGAGVQGKGCKTPLGNGTTFELIQTPTKMAQYLGKDRDGVNWPIREPHLPMELLNFVLITGEDSLCHSYRKALDEELSNPYREGIDLRSYLGRVHLVKEDEQQFDPELGDLNKEGQLFKIKQDLYRLPHLSIDRLALLLGITSLSTISRLENLIGLLRIEAVRRLQGLISETMFQRLKVYSHYKAQQEFMNPLLKAFGFVVSGILQFALNERELEKLTKMYQVLLPFHKAIHSYLEGNAASFQDNVLWDESDLTLGKIFTRLLQYPKAKTYYQKVKTSAENLSLDYYLAIRALGHIELELRHAKEAINFFQKALDILKRRQIRHPSYAMAVLLMDMGRAYQALNNHKKAFTYMQKSVEILKKIYVQESPEIVRGLIHLGTAYQKIENYKKALLLQEQGLTILKKTHGKEHLDVATTLNNIGLIYRDQGQAREALIRFQKCLTIKEKLYGAYHPIIAISLSNLGITYEDLGKPRLALSYHQRALEIRHKIYGGEHLDTAESLNNVGKCHQDLGNHRKALSNFRNALAVFEKSGHSTIAVLLDNMGNSYQELGDFQAALSCYKRAMAIYETNYKNNQHMAICLEQMGLVYERQGNLIESMSCYERSLKIHQSVFGKEHPGIAACLSGIGRIYHEQGNYKKGLSYCKEALEIFEKTVGNEHPGTAIAFGNIGVVYNSYGRPHDALFYLKKAHSILKKNYGGEHPYVATALNNIGDVYLELGQPHEVLSHCEKALLVFRKNYGEEHICVANCLNIIGEAYYCLGELQKALSMCTRALGIFKKAHQAIKNHPSIAISTNKIGLILQEEGKLKEALSAYGQALEIFRKNYGKEHPQVAKCLNNIGMLYEQQGEHLTALSYCEKAAKIFEPRGDSSPTAAMTFISVGKIYQELEEWNKAISYLTKALAITETIYGKESQSIIGISGNLGTIHQILGNNNEALLYYHKALAILKKCNGKQHLEQSATINNNIGMLYQKMGDLKKAIPYWKNTLDIWQVIYGKEHPKVISYLSHISKLLK